MHSLRRRVAAFHRSPLPPLWRSVMTLSTTMRRPPYHEHHRQHPGYTPPATPLWSSLAPVPQSQVAVLCLQQQRRGCASSSSSPAACIPRAVLEHHEDALWHPLTAVYGAVLYDLEALMAATPAARPFTFTATAAAGPPHASTSGSDVTPPSRGSIDTQTHTSNVKNSHTTTSASTTNPTTTAAAIATGGGGGGIGTTVAAMLIGSRSTERKARRAQRKSASSLGGDGDDDAAIVHYAAKTVLRYPLLNTRHAAAASSSSSLSSSQTAQASGGTASSHHQHHAASATPIGAATGSLRKLQYLAGRAPEMLVLEITALQRDVDTATATATPTTATGTGQTSSQSGQPAQPAQPPSAQAPMRVVGVHYCGVFNDGTLVSFGLSDSVLLALERHVLKACAEPKDRMLVADAAAIAAHNAAEADGQSLQQYHLQHSTTSGGSNNSGSVQSTASPLAQAHITVRHRYTTTAALAAHGVRVPAHVDSFVDSGACDAVVLAECAPMALLPFVFCFYHMTQLRALGAMTMPIKDRVSAWQQHVASKGTLPMSLKEARVLKARLLRMSARASKSAAARHRVLWSEAHVRERSVFLAATQHFELAAAADALRSRAEGLQGALAYLCDQAHQQKDYHLEYVIIVLIAVEVLLAWKTH